MYFVYFIKSERNGKTYVGFTEKPPEGRLNEHNQGGEAFTRNNRPFHLLYYERYICKEDALLREKFYKSGLGRKIRDAIIGAVSARDGSASSATS